jgi:hypothetical protein
VLTIAARQAAGMLRGRSFWVLTALGAALVAVGAYRVIVPAGNGGQVAAVTAGCLLLVCPFVISRVEQLTVGRPASRCCSAGKRPTRARPRPRRPNGPDRETAPLGELRLDQTTHPLRADADPPRHWTEIRRVSQQNIPSGKARNCGSRRNCAPQRVIAVFQCTIDPSRADDIGHAFLALASVVATGP